jgi:hypothetical protein
MYLTAERLEECQSRMAGDLTDKSALFIEVHSLKVGFVCGEDLVGLWDNPDLQERKSISNRTWKYERSQHIPRSCHPQ